MMIARLNRVYDSENTIDAALNTAPAPDRPRVDYYSSRTEEDPFPDQSLLDRLDEPQAAAVQTAIDAALRQAKENGLPPDSAAALDDLVRVHTNVFRVGFSAGPPANIRPLKITLTPDARPVKVRLRNYSCEQREFLAAFVDELVRNGMAFANPTSAWASAPLLVPKAGPSRFRFTVDLRPVNKFTVKHHYPMPHLEHELPKLSASQFFATFDLSHGYWQLELDESSQQLQSFITPDGIYTPTRVLHGTTNAVTHLQSSLAEAVPPTLRQFLLHWLDDVLLHHSTVEGLLDAVRQFLLLCVKLNLKLHPAKSVFFATSVRWCGRLISAEGIRYDPRRLEGLLQMEPPTSGAHLQQFICALQWVRHGIPQFARLVQPLQEFMERVCEHAGKRTARAVARVQLSALGWDNSERAAFEACKSALAHQVTLSHRDERQRLCFFTDASDMVWSGIVTQVPREDLVKPHVAQRHQPLAFLSGRFNATQLGWSVLEKEAFAVLASLERMHWLAATPDGFDLSTDHNNLVFIFDPLSIVPDMSQTTLRKVLRWAVRLSTYNYTCLHIKGTDNVWADLLGRWSAPATIRRLIRIPELPSSSDPDFEWPSLDSLADAQQTYAAIRPPGLSQSHAVLRNPEGAIWIPDPASDLQLRLCVIAHTGPSGHRGQAVTESALRQHYYWSTMSADVRSFVRACIHCLSTVGGGKIPRPYGPSVHGTSPNDLLQFDYIEIGPGHKGEKYVLMLRDDHSSYAWFFPFAETSAENAAIALIDWCAAFGVPQGLMSDGPTHFRNETLRLLAKGLKTPHHFTLPYSPWSNGAIERLGKEMLRVFRSVISELRMGFNEWPDILPLVQSVLNNSPSPQRQNIAPLTAFTGNLPTPPISTFVRSSTATPVTLSDAQKERLQNINALKDRITELRPLVQESLRVQREKGRAAASRGALANFLEGDFVLVARDDFSAGEKLALRWRGPRRIVKAINDYVYQVEDLRNGVLEEVHATRLKFYRDASLDSVAILPHVLSSETGMPVARLMRLYEDEDGLKVVVRWKGLSHSEDTSEPLRHVYEDVPDMLIRLLQRKNTPQDLAAKARTVLAL
jgi:transposase InsO family protein